MQGKVVLETNQCLFSALAKNPSAMVSTFKMDSKPPKSPHSVGDALLNRKRFRILGLTIDDLIKVFFNGNAVVAVIVLALITIFLFREGIGFFGQNLRNLHIYRLAGLEYVDFLRTEVDQH